MATDLSAKHYDASLHESIVREWALARGLGGAGALVTPPLGVVVEDGKGELLCACWAHLSVNYGVAFLEDPISKPGVCLASMSAAFAVALGALEAVCIDKDYTVMVVNTVPGIARWLQFRGFKVADTRQKITLTKQLVA